jgi:hypothetical protein
MTKNLSIVGVMKTRVGDCGAIPDEATGDIPADTARTNRAIACVE